MATLWLHVFSTAEQVAIGEPIQKISVAIGSAAVSSDPLDADPVNADARRRRRVRFFADAACHVVWGASPQEATTADVPIGAENPEYFDVEAKHIVSVIERI